MSSNDLFGASSSAAVAPLAVDPSAPSATQLQFARAVILTMELWPAMRLAVSEQWGGVESADKREFIISHICDTYSDEPSAAAVALATASQSQSQQQQQQQQRNVIAAPSTPDVDDLADTLQMYFDDEFETRIEDSSAEWVAARIVHLHKVIYDVFPPTQTSLSQANEEIDKLYQATVQLRGQKISIEQTQAAADGETLAGSDDGESDDDDGVDAQQLAGLHLNGINGEGSNGNAQQQSQRREREEPIVDEDGFTTVVKGKRRP